MFMNLVFSTVLTVDRGMVISTNQSACEISIVHLIGWCDNHMTID